MAGRPPKKIWDQFTEDSIDLTTAELAEQYKRHSRTIRDWRNFLAGKGYKVGRGYGIPTLEPRPRYNIPTLDKYEKLEGDAIVVGDLHLPFVKWKWASWLLKIAERFDIRRLLVVGDLLDAKALTYFPKKEAAVKWEVELREAENFIDCMCDWFTEIIYCYGNHERNRIIARFEGELTAERFGRLISTDSALKVSPYSYVILHTEAGKWRLTHQRNYRKTPLSVAKNLCEMHLCHIMAHHQHRMAQGFDASGNFMLVDNGGLMDEEKMDWVMLEDRVMPKPTNGFTVIHRGRPYLFNSASDFRFWLGGD